MKSNEPQTHVTETPETKRRPFGSKVLIIFLIVLMLVPICWFGVFGFEVYWGMRETVHKADAGFAKLKMSTDPEQLRTWALQEISQHPITNSVDYRQTIPSWELPNYLQNLYKDPPEDASVQRNNNQLYVNICWGGGFFHWIIDIGTTNFSETVGEANDYTTAKWVDGIYYSREDTAHPIK